MRFLADMGVSMRVVKHLRGHSHDVQHLRELGLRRISDESIADRARSESRVVLTFDLDFGEIMALGRHTLPSVVIFRLRDATPNAVILRLDEIVGPHARELQEGAIILVEDGRHRIRKLPLWDTDSP